MLLSIYVGYCLLNSYKNRYLIIERFGNNFSDYE